RDELLAPVVLLVNSYGLAAVFDRVDEGGVVRGSQGVFSLPAWPSPLEFRVAKLDDVTRLNILAGALPLQAGFRSFLVHDKLAPDIVFLLREIRVEEPRLGSGGAEGLRGQGVAIAGTNLLAFVLPTELDNLLAE